MGHLASKQFNPSMLSAGQNPSQAQLLLAGGPQTNFMHKKQSEEVHLLKQVVQRLCTKLKDYQKQFNSNKSLLAGEQAQIDHIVNGALAAG